ncbi:MAG: ABC transporter substrate-binding protein [Alphaproteobacteria bacterium]|nr:ABC transporter substrate-binding protein [Alphaproteobacteria bacterium]
MHRTFRLTLIGSAALALASGAALAQNKYGPGVTDKEIKIGNTNPYSGPASSYGTIGKAISAYFKMVNEQGGINGRQINFISLDDGYQPPKAKEQVRRLVEKDEVAALFQTLGTPTNSAIHEYMNEAKVPHLFVATGATKWGNPKEFPWTMGFQPTYQTFGRIAAAYILKNHPNAKIGILYQNDDYGKDYLHGLELGLGKDGYKKLVVSAQSYEVTDPTVDSQVVNLKASGADVFYNITIPKFAAQAIRKAHDIGWTQVHLLNDVSGSVSAVLKPAGLDKSQGIITAAYLKDPTDPTWKDDAEFKEWTAWMNKYYPDGDKASSFNVYGFTVAQLMEQTLKQAGNDLTRENIMKQAANLKNFRAKMLLPGIQVNTSPSDFYPVEQMQLQRFEGETWKLFGPIFNADGSTS